MTTRINLVLLYGGNSGEHEISLISAGSILRTLDPERYHIIPVGIDKKGCYFLNDYQALLAFSDAIPVQTVDSKPLDSLVIQGRFVLDADVVFPALHGPLYEDGCFQGLLELAGIAYVGCGVLSSAVGMDKDMARRLACVDDVQSTQYHRLSSTLTGEALEAACRKAVDALGWPLFVKPCSMGSSVGIHKATTLPELQLAVSDAGHYDEEILIEAFVAGREIELAVLENPTMPGSPQVSLPGEIRVHHPDGFYSYSAKYLEDSQTDLDVPALLPEATVRRLQAMAVDVFVRLKCRGMARVDFFLENETGNLIFNEINTLPGFTGISMYPKLWAASGISTPVLLDRLVDCALHHRRHRNQLVTHYK